MIKARRILIFACVLILILQLIDIWNDKVIEEGYYCSTDVEVPEIKEPHPFLGIVQTFEGGG